MKRETELRSPPVPIRVGAGGTFTLCSLTPALGLVCCILASGCQQKMADQPRYDPLEPARFFARGQSARLSPPGTLARDEAWSDLHLLTGRKAGAPRTKSPDRPTPSLDHPEEYEETFPFPVSVELVRHGRQRFDIFCVACHGKGGEGSGAVVQSGYPQAQSFHTDRLRQAPAGYLFDVITHGYQAMPAFAGQIPPRDRWAIIAYVHALQLSQHAKLKELPTAIRRRFP